MSLSWNEIKHNAIKFSHEWAGAKSEKADKQTFWNEFFEVFGIKRRVIASFEEPVKKLSGKYGYIDLFWRGTLLVEHKSFGQDLGKAESQAIDYIQDLVREGRQDEVPKYVIVSDFAKIALHDLENDKQSVTFPLAHFHRYIHSFSFIPGLKQHTFEDQDPINILAVQIMSRLHDTLAKGGYSGHQLERFLVRILFCLFAEDTGIFEREAFRIYIEDNTKEDGSDLGPHLARLFDVLNTPIEKRQVNLDETLKDFPYVDGDLFAESLGFADFNQDMRNALLATTRFDWSSISPAIFGSLFQSVIEQKERRQIGAHYTSERDILKVVRSLFLDELKEEFKNICNLTGARRKARLDEFHKKICSLRFLDPACGCGNFLVITYRELRQLELEVLKELLGFGTGPIKTFQREFTLDEINRLSKVDVDQMYGIEIKEWPVRIAEVALWLMDHQMNIKVSETFGQLYQRLPLKKRPNIVQGNSLRLDWNQVVPASKCNYILGNPPFVGGKYQTEDQRADMNLITENINGAGLLDYVTGWYLKAAQYIQGTQIIVGFVSTNSITQGEQAGILWNFLFKQSGIKIHFGHRTFPWESEARGKAHVHVVIIGFACFDIKNKKIYDFNVDGDQTTVTVGTNISPYLVFGPDRAIVNKPKAICKSPEICFGNQPNDDGNLLFDRKDKDEFLLKEPKAIKYFRPFLGADEFINGRERWCLWLKQASPTELREMPEIMNRIDKVKNYRLKSKRPATRDLAQTPALFGFISQPQTSYVLIPRHSSENRRYIPISFVNPEYIVGDSCLFIANANIYHFGVLTSAMHMAWVRQVCGRLESRYRYSNKLVYNNFPWPQNLTDKQKADVENEAKNVLAVREEFPNSSLADLYDPLTMPTKLLKVHAKLDRAVDLCYRKSPFTNDRERFEFLFELYERLIAPLVTSRTVKMDRK